MRKTVVGVIIGILFINLILCCNVGFVASASTYTLTISATAGGTTSPSPGQYHYSEGLFVCVIAIPNIGYKLDHWELDGQNKGSESGIYVYMNTTHNLHAIFVSTDDVIIKAYCFNEGKDPGLNITMDGEDTGFKTPHNFVGLTGAHNFTVPYTDPSGHSFVNWNGSKSSSAIKITISSAGEYTAYYYTYYPPPPPIYTLNIDTTSGGTTDPAPGTHDYYAGSVVPVTAYAYANYAFDHWELDGVWYYVNPISVTMNNNHYLFAVFYYSPPSVGGVVVPVDKFGLLASYIGLASTILVATAATAIYVKRVKHVKEE